MKRYIIQYQRWQSEQWYDNPSQTYNCETEGDVALRALRTASRELGWGYRYRLILRETIETVIDETATNEPNTHAACGAIEL